MKVGILTYHYIYNFGAQLQTYATVCALRKLNHEPIVINYIHTDLMSDYYQREVPENQQAAHEYFINTYLPITEKCVSVNELVEVVDKHNLKNIIVGSDAVFLLSYPYERYSDTIYPSVYWMGWLDKCKNHEQIRVFGLSVSAMNANFLRFPKHYIKGLRESLQNFEKVYYRDNWTKLFVNYLQRNTRIKHSPDPVLSLNSLVDRNIIDSVKLPVTGKYILYGVGGKVGIKHHKLLYEIKQKVNDLGYKFIALPFPEGYYNELDDEKISVALNPLEWYKLIQNSSGYIGEKFHPIIISIHNNIPFFAIDRNADRVSRKFIFPIRLRFQSKTFDVCRRYGFKFGYVPLSLLGTKDADLITGILFSNKWDFTKVKPEANKFVETIRSFNI